MSNSLTCNVCYNHVDGIAYLTSCNHFYCPDCTKSIFKDSSYCPVCQYSLHENDLKETMIGIETKNSTEFLFQNILESTSWKDIFESLKKCSLAMADIQSFISTQLLFQNSLSNHAKNSIQSDLQAQSSIMQQLNEKIVELNHQSELLHYNFEQKLQEKNKELCELQDAYKEKLRKCLAWEKAYNNIRNQINSGSNNKVVGKELPLSLMQQTEEMRHSIAYNPDIPNQLLKTEISTYRRKLSSKEHVLVPQSKHMSYLHSDHATTYPFQLLQQQANYSNLLYPNFSSTNNKDMTNQLSYGTNSINEIMPIQSNTNLAPKQQILSKQQGLNTIANISKSYTGSEMTNHTYMHKFKTSFFEDH